MHWHDLDLGHGVLELPSVAVEKAEVGQPLELELAVWWGGGAPSRAAWLWSQTGELAAWVVVGEA